MATLIARLAGPLQSWGAESRLRTASTHSTPTWSGLLGLARAALGHGRTDPLEDIQWLRELAMAVRIDQPGTIHTDYQTINPLPAEYERFALFSRADRGLVPLGTTLQASGQAPRWLKGEAPMQTRRQYLHDASFLWLVSGPADDVQKLANALTAPRWTLALGRKGCTPASPMLLGIHPGQLLHAAESAPLTGNPSRNRSRYPAPPTTDTGGSAIESEARQTVELVWLHGAPDPALTTTGTRVLLDSPLGGHPQNGYSAGNHTLGTITAPTGTDVLAWAEKTLTHPARATDQGAIE